MSLRAVGIRLARLRGDLREIYAALALWNKPDWLPSPPRWLGYSTGRGQLLEDVGALAGIGPAGAQFVRAGALVLAPLCLLPSDDNPSIREDPLLGDGVRFVVPARRLKFRHHEFPACVRFVWHPM